jgi:hypothetical protein
MFKRQKSEKKNPPAAPVVDVIVRYDARTGETTVGVFGAGSPIDSQQIHRILDQGHDAVRALELQALQRGGAPQQTG